MRSGMTNADFDMIRTPSLLVCFQFMQTLQACIVSEGYFRLVGAEGFSSPNI